MPPIRALELLRIDTSASDSPLDLLLCTQSWAAQTGPTPRRTSGTQSPYVTERHVPIGA